MHNVFHVFLFTGHSGIHKISWHGIYRDHSMISGNFLSAFFISLFVLVLIGVLTFYPAYIVYALFAGIIVMLTFAKAKTRRKY